jgi:hypothetical protein
MSQQPAGWYRDPVHVADYRWWDGAAWTAEVRTDPHLPAGGDPARSAPDDDLVTSPAEPARPGWAGGDPTGWTDRTGDGTGAAVGERPHHRRLLTLAVAVLILLAGIGYLLNRADAASTTAAAIGAGSSPAQVLSAALAAAGREGGVHVHDVSAGDKQSVVSDYYIGADAGRQVVVSGSSRATILVTGGRGYVRGNAGGLGLVLGLTGSVAQQLANTWISFSPGDAPYAAVVQDDTLSSEITDLTLTGTLSRSLGTVAGAAVVSVSGLLPPSAVGTTSPAPATLAVSRASSLPVRLLIHSSQVTETVTFTDWGSHYPVRAPSGATAFSTLAGGGAPATGA